MEGLDLAGDDTAWPVCISRWVTPWPSAPTPPARAKPVPARPEQPGAAVLRRASELHERGMTEGSPGCVFVVFTLCLNDETVFEEERSVLPSSEPNRQCAGRRRTDSPR